MYVEKRGERKRLRLRGAYHADLDEGQDSRLQLGRGGLCGCDTPMVVHLDSIQEQLEVQHRNQWPKYAGD